MELYSGVGNPRTAIRCCVLPKICNASSIFREDIQHLMRNGRKHKLTYQTHFP